MKKILAALALALVSTSAHAGIGATASIGGTNDGAVMGLQAPSLDWRGGGVLAQVHLLDLIGELTNERVELGVDVSGVVHKRKVGPDVEGVIMPGGTLNFSTPTSFRNASWQVLAQTRFGAEMKQGMGFGIYVVPQIGVSNFTGDVGLSYGGTLQVSAWMVNEGGGGGGRGKKNK
jgi:hypothetical protein